MRDKHVRKTVNKFSVDAKQLCLAKAVDDNLQAYLLGLAGQQPIGLYNMVLHEVEQVLFERVMKLTQGNQSEAAKVLGINRNTLRAKLTKYDLLP